MFQVGFTINLGCLSFLLTWNTRAHSPSAVLACRADSERRASLHIRFIRSNPMVTTKCCKALHCYR